MTIGTEYTTIQISKNLKISIQDMGKKGQTYNEIIQKLLEKYGTKK